MKQPRPRSAYDRKRMNDPENIWQDALNRGVMKEIDPEIREMIMTLNNNRQYTVDSCAGHGTAIDPKVPRLSGRGYVGFDAKTKISDRYIRAVLNYYGMENVKRRKDDRTIYYYFNPVGVRRWGRVI